MTVSVAEILAALGTHVPAAGAHPASVRLVRSPGRINLIGEHTDYNEGFVLPMAIDRDVVIAFVPSDDRRVELTRLDTGEVARVELDAEYQPGGTWVDYIGGMAAVLARRGVGLGGMRGVIASSLPIAAGLSSSAAMEVAVAWALTGGQRPPLGPVELAGAGQEVEHEFVGVNSGLMDQLAVILGRRAEALLIDCRSLEHRGVPLRLEPHALIAVDSGSPRRLGSSAYNQRRAECEAVVSAIAARSPGVRSLRDVDLEMLATVGTRVGASAAARAEHVIRENHRVLACVSALERDDFGAVGDLLAASHASLRDLFEVSSPELDALVAIATSTPGVIGARMTGGGFGGSIVAIVQQDQVEPLREAITRRYSGKTGLRATLHVVEPADGAGSMDAGT